MFLIHTFGRFQFLLLVVMMGTLVPNALAGRKFTFVYQATTEEKGEVEYEQWLTWSTRKESDTTFDRLDFRHELEIGLTDHLQLAIYLLDWRYQDGVSVQNDRVEYRDTAFELIYNLSDPVDHLVGSAIYGEFKVGDQLLKLEGKVILQKDLGLWTFAYNATIEAEWEGRRYGDDNGEFEQAFGVSYHLLDSLLIGAELVHEVGFPDWNDVDDHVVHAGPNLSYQAHEWWITVTPLFQVTDVESEPDFVTRVIFGFEF